MKSMTGYGHAKSSSKSNFIEVSIRAVNGRFFELRTHLPKELFALESDIKKIVQENIERGTVDIFVSLKPKSDAATSNVVVNRKLVRKYIDAVKEIAKEIKVKPQIHLEFLARLPDVLKVEESHEFDSTEKKSIFDVVKKACLSIDKEKSREGRSLKLDLEKNLNNLEIEISKIKEFRQDINKSLSSKYEQKIQSKLGSLEIDSNRLVQEIVIQLDKTDINEELNRLEEHINNYRNLFEIMTPVGKKLDFYTQELLREINTIGSKSNVSQVTQSVVEAKTLIERLREQVQNIE